MVDYWRFTRNRHTRMMYDALKTYGITATRMYEYRTAGDVSVTPSLKPPDGVTVESLHASELGSLAGDIDFSLPVTVSNGEWTVVASADGRPIGRALVTDDPNPYVDPLERQVSVSGAYVRKIFVVPGWRGAGVASATLRRAVAIACERLGARTVTALVAADNRPSCRLFEGCGFERAGTHEYVRVGPLSAYRHRNS